MLDGLKKLLDECDARRAADAARYAALDRDTCQLCDAHGEDKRALFISCMYAVHEVVPEAIDLLSRRGGRTDERPAHHV